MRVITGALSVFPGSCPVVEDGPGRVVLTTVTHLNGYVLRIHLADQAEPLEPTKTHRLYSEDRDAWVPAGELTVGEHLRTLTGPAEITQIASRPGVHRVYNLEVETEHCYYVSTAGVLSHNTDNPCGVNLFAEVFDTAEDAIGMDAINGIRFVEDAVTKEGGAIAQGFTKVKRYLDSMNHKWSVYYNPTTAKYTGAHSSISNY